MEREVKDHHLADMLIQRENGAVTRAYYERRGMQG